MRELSRFSCCLFAGSLLRARRACDHLGRIALACVAVFAVAGCRPQVDAERLTRSPWCVVDVELQAPAAPGFASGANDAVDASAGAWFRFFPDGAATFVLESRFHVGQWTLDADKRAVAIALPGGAVRVFRVVPAPGGLRLSEVAEGNTATFVVEADAFDYGDRDIYSAAMNLWRVPLDAEATDDVLRARLQSMMRYLAAYFEAAAVKDLETVNVSALSTPFIFAANGLGLRQEDALPVEWIVLFSEREDCRRMSRLIGSLFRDVSPPATKNRFLQYASMFRQMDRLLDAMLPAGMEVKASP